ncbi:hypothetical protein [Chryseobacterium terrae]|uniref:Uncharacterized protein n=1 Tax=Chryseobacterium terrae TaxID=3163299 RepID=A0ABW8Y519_9FLAO
MKRITSKKSDRKNESQDRITNISQNTLKNVSFERSKKLLTESGLNPTDDEVRSIMDFAHQLTDLIIKTYILK